MFVVAPNWRWRSRNTRLIKKEDNLREVIRGLLQVLNGQGSLFRFQNDKQAISRRATVLVC